MADISHFESRSGKPDCTPDEIFRFVTDLRNFKRFIPSDTVSDWESSRDHCNFRIQGMGNVTLTIAREEIPNLVAYKGNALKDNDFDIVVNIAGNQYGKAEVKVSLNAELNPMVKMIAAKPIGQFLEMLVDRMESFSCSDLQDTNSTSLK
jgi:carbon monoxide dehydrogenase subunit G